MKNVFLFITMILWSVTSLADGHFITDAQYRQTVENAFQSKLSLIGKQFYELKGLSPTTEEQEALQFLYAYMPLADATDYTTNFYLGNVRMSFKARQEMPWGQKIPELLFRHFVLPMRVNNENLDSARIVLYEELKQRVKGMSMKDAILEINHWCHEHVTYHPSDGRTLSPLACMKNALGRCGEESTFTVAMLRTIGIPARQVYTPRWAHTDDNHAWVEAWADGTWYFLGACEPEAVLNLGWFNAPASRAMLMHTRAFGDYRGPEEVVLKTTNFTEINLIDNYAKTARVDFTVLDQTGKPVEGARVDFKIYNYAEFYTAVSKYTDKQGKTFLTSGLGDLLVWASKDGHYGYAKASFGKDREVTIQLNRSHATDIKERAFPIDMLTIVPPPENVKLPEVSDEQNARNKVRFAEEDSIRKAYEHTFWPYQKGPKVSEEVNKLLTTARGNWRTILAFLQKHGDRQQRAIDLLKSLSDKDLRDIKMEILEDNMNAPSDQLCPRVETEMLITPFKQYLAKAFSKTEIEKFRADPALLVRWTRDHIRLNPDDKALRIPQTPMGVWRSRMTDSRSRDIFFVDLARSLNIEAQEDVVTGKVQYKQGGKWIDVDFEAAEQQSAPQGTLVLNYEPTKLLDNPKYYSHFSISEIENGRTYLLNFEEGQVDMGGGTSWANTFKNGTKLDEGTYLLTTGTRLANGSVLVNNQTFNIRRGETTTLDLKMRAADNEVAVIGNFDSESKFVRDGTEVSLLSQTGRGYFVLGILGVGQEPTNHALNDIAKVKKQLDEWGRPFVLLFESEADARKFNLKEFGALPEKTIFGIDRDGSIKKQIVSQMKLSNDRLLPIFIIGDTFNRVVFSSQGYTIGLGEQLQKVINKL
ncbi:transglutaminase family protein [Prevotella sp. KH2C16]|uniref:transglutaminase-like domain-containing protein n=1 Tax=Prevotella sp. KH2C16 TaxID=1855325 RepID=UPI0008F279C7|nr:transglutaminase-like domain-containing protein [Prevotella sp. KH2C16]SFF90745.1 Transglutaminase-like superfamily protein [Prevotella sp. KH2C16]